jgi:hypothetical protein
MGNSLRERLAERGTKAVIPPNPTRKHSPIRVKAYKDRPRSRRRDFQGVCAVLRNYGRCVPLTMFATIFGEDRALPAPRAVLSRRNYLSLLGVRITLARSRRFR